MDGKKLNGIFIVGASRSGTNLMRSILNLHSSINITGETHYFDDLRPKLKGKIQRRPLAQQTITQVEKYFLSLGHRTYDHGGNPNESRINVEDLRQIAHEEGGTADDYFYAYCKLDSGSGDYEYWGEKTPRHIFRIIDILSAYPNSKIICMIRDPRAVTASYRDWKNQGGFDLEKDPAHREAIVIEATRARKSYHIIINNLLWKTGAMAALSSKKIKGSDHVWLQRYEDIAANPEGEIRKIAKWIGVEFEEKMLEAPKTNSSFSIYQKGSGVYKEAVSRWRKKLTDAEIAVVQDCNKSLMEEFGYPIEKVNTHIYARLAPWLTLPAATVRSAIANRHRTGSILRYLYRRLGFIMSK